MILIIGGAYQGKTEYAQEAFGAEHEIVNQYHEVVRRQLLDGENPEKQAERLLGEKKDIVIISDEVGYGLVPVDSFERAYREAVGRVNCFFAKQAEQVIRVVCGVGTRIK
jgi:adenosylcobinamide kinase/adenosylcobinamide-phosphate guanylyltransferase